jgi:4-amino-4-deoxy-L-arabinose transferase-like glycosyltransferase
MLSSKKITWLIILALFIASFLIRLPELEKPYITFDEHVYFNGGIGNANAAVWNNPDPMFYDNPPLTGYYFGLWNKLATMFGKEGYLPVLAFTRIGAILLGCFTVIFIFLIGKELFGEKVGIFSALILMLMPLFAGFSRLDTTEIVLLFAYSLAFLIFLKTKNKKIWQQLLGLGIASGVLLLTKYSGVLAVLLLSCLFTLNNLDKFKRFFKNKVLSFGFGWLASSIALFIAAGIIMFLCWPFLQNNLGHSLSLILNSAKGRSTTTVLMFLETIGEYLIYIITKTPLLVLVLAIFGFTTLERKNKWNLLAWFIVPFLIAFSGIIRGRYALPAILSICLLASVGFWKLHEKYPILKKKGLGIVLIMGYLIILTLMSHPFYTNYYNVLVGGPKGAFELAKTNPVFDIGEWGDGLGEATMYVFNSATQNSTVQFYTEPNAFYIGIRRDLNYINPSSPPVADYVVLNNMCSVRQKGCAVNWWWIITNQTANIDHNLNVTYDTLDQNKNYKIVFQASIMNAPLARVYKKMTPFDLI